MKVKHYLYGVIETMIYCYNYFPPPANKLSSSKIRKDMLGNYTNKELYNIAKETDHDLEFNLELIEIGLED